jgi:hypothetical protein
MKRLAYSICIGSLAFALAAQGEEITTTTNARANKKARGTTNVQASTTTNTHVRSNNSGQARIQRNVSSNQFRQRSQVSRPVTTTSSANLRHNRVRNASVRTASEQNISAPNRIRRHNDVTVNRDQNFARNQSGNLRRDRSNVTVNRERNVTVNRTRNVTVNNNWRGDRFSGQHYSAFRNYHRQWHDRNWWSSRYNRIIFVSGGWYYWNSGYWYPAWGYAQTSYYPYDGPIYGYNDYSPDRITMEVQTQLQRDGYYDGPIDGVLGPVTRQAITAFQADHGLAVTSAIDEPTLASLGLV